MKNIFVTKRQIDYALNKEQFIYNFKIEKENHYQLDILGDSILNIYFKNNGRTSFLYQGKNQDIAEKFAKDMLDLLAVKY